MKKKIILSFVGIIVIVIGIFAAYFVVEANKDAAVIEDTDAKFTSDLIEISDNSTPEEHSASDVIAMALWKIANTDAFRTETTGTADASIATQLIAGERIVIGDNAMVRSISSGFVSVGSERFFYKDKVLLREPESIDGVNATFKTVEPECLTIDGYMQRYGWLPFQATGYIISKDTFLTEPTMVNNGDGTYTLIMDLNPDGDYAPFWYRREVLTNSSSTIIPEFFKIHMEMTIDSTYRILSNDIQEEYQVKSMGVTATSKTKVHEVFYYDNISFPEDITNFYDQYKGMEASNGEETKKDPDNLSIITEALIGKTSNYQVNINLNGEDINGNVYLNLLDIDNVNVVAELLDGELYVEFTDALYLSYGNIKLKLDINELSSLIPASETEGEGSSSIDVAGIIADIQNGKVSKVDNLTVISTTLNIMGIKINVIFEVKVTEDAYTMQAISGIITLAGFDIKVSLKPTDKKVEKRDTNEFMNIMNSKDIISKIIDIVSNKKIDLSLNLEYQGIKASGVVTLDFNDSLKALANLDLKVNNETYNIKAIYQDKVIYLDFKNIHAKISVDTLTSLFDLGELKNNSNIKIVEMLSSDEIKNLINFEELGENIKVLISASSINSLIKKELLTENIKININATDDKVNLSVNMLDLNISLSKSENVIDINPDNYVSLDNLVKNAFDIYNTLKDGGRININANIDLKELANIDLTVSINGYIDLFIDGKDIAISGILNLGLGNNNIEVKILFEDNTLTVELFNNTIRLTVDEIKNLINEITTRFNLTNNTFKLNINELLDGITLNDDGVCVDLSSILSKLGIVSVSLRDKVEVSSGLFNAEITFANLEEKVTFEGDVITYDDIISILDKVNVITSIVDDKKFDFVLSFIYNSNVKASINGTLDLSDLENIKAKLNAKLSYKEYLFELDITFINNKLYVDFNNIHGALSLDTIKSLIPTSDIKFDLDINSTIDLVFKLVKEINIKDLKLTLAKDELNNLLNGFVGDLFKFDDDLVIDLDITDKVSVDINLFDIALTIAKTDANIEVNEDNYIALDSLVLNIVDIVKDVMDGARINIDANINLKDIANIDLTIDLTGYVDLIKENDKFIISSILNVKVSNSTLTVKLLFEDNTLTIEVLNNRVRLTVDEIKELINEISTRYLKDTNTKLDISVSELLNGIKLTEKGISLDLSSLLQKLGVINLEISEGKLNVTNNSFNAEVSLAEAGEKLTFNDDVITYSNIIEFLDKIDIVIDIIEEKKFDVSLSLKYKDLDIDITGVVDLNDGIKVAVAAKINESVLFVKFINNTIYLDFDNIHISLSLDTIKKFIGSDNTETTKELDINKIVDLVFNLIDKIDLKNIVINLKKDEINKLLEEYLMNLITVDEDVVIDLDVANKVTLDINLFDIHAELAKSSRSITVNEDEYSKVDTLIEKVYDIYLKAKDGRRVNIDAEVNLKELADVDLTLGLKGYIDVLVNEGNISLSSELTVKLGDNDINVKFLYEDNVITVNVLDNTIKLTVDEIKDLIAEITSKFVGGSTSTDDTAIDIVGLLKGIEISEDSITVDLTTLFDKLGVVTLKVLDEEIKLTSSSINANITLSDVGTKLDINTDNALTKADIDDMLDNLSFVSDIIKDKKLALALSLKYKDITLAGNAVIDFNDELKLEANLDVAYKDINVSANVKLVNNVIYLDLDNIHAKLELETIKGLIGTDSESKLDINKIIDLVFKSLDKIDLKNLVISFKTTEINKLINDLAKELIKEDILAEDLIIDIDLEDKAIVKLNQFDLIAELTKTDKDITVEEDNYQSVDDLVKTIVDIVKDVLDDNGTRLNINANVNLKDLADIDLALGLTGYLDITKDSNDKFVISSLLKVKVSETEIEVKVLFEDDTLTINLLDNTIRITVDEIKDLIAQIKTRFVKETSESSLDINSIISGLSLNASGISADLSSILDKLGVISLSVSKDEINITNDSITASITFAEVGDKVIMPLEVINYDDVNELLDKVEKVIDVIEDKKIDLTLSLKYKDITLSGVVALDFNDELILEANLDVTYKDINLSVKAKLINDVIYLDLANIHVKLELDTLMGLLSETGSESKLEIGKLVDKLYPMLKKLDLKNLDITLDKTELNKLVNEYLEKLIKEDLFDEDLILDIDISDEISLTTNKFDLAIKLSKSDKDITVDEDEYLAADDLVKTLVDIIKDVLDENGARINLSANVNLKELADIDLTLGVTGYVDITKDTNDELVISGLIKVKVSETEIELKLLYKDEKIKVEILDNIIELEKDNLKPLLEEITTKFELDSTLDINKIIEGVSFVDAKTIKLDLSALTDKLGAFNVVIDSDLITATNDSISANITFAEAGDLVEIADATTNYDDVLDLLDKVKYIVDLVKDKKLNVALSFKYDDELSVSATALIDFEDEIKARVNATINYKEKTFNLTATIIDKVIYIDLANVHASVKLETIMSILNDSDTESEFEIGKLIDKLYPMLKTIDLNNLDITLDKTELNKIANEYLEKLLDEDLAKEDVTLDVEVNNNIKVTANLFDLDVVVTKATDEIALDSTITYVELDDTASKLINILQDVLDEDGARINLDATINLKKLLNMDMDVKLTGYADITKDENDKIVVSSYINIKIKDYIAELYILFENDELYVKGFNNATKLTKTEIKEIIERIQTKYLADSNLDIDLSTIIDNIFVTESDMKLDLTSIHEILANLVLVVSDNEISLTNESINLTATLAEAGDKIVINSYNIDYARITQILDNFDYIYDIIMNKKNYEFDFELEVLDNYEKNIDVSGKINVMIQEDGSWNIKIKGNILHKNIDHQVEIYYVSNPKSEDDEYYFLKGNIYFVYGNNCGSNKKLTFDSTVENILLIIEQVASFLGVEDVDMANNPKSVLGILDELDLGTGTNNTELVVSDLLSELVFTDDSIKMDISNKLLFHYATRLMNVVITAKPGELSGSLNGIYTKYLDEANNTMLNVTSFKLTNNTTTFSVPSCTYHIKDSHLLVEGLVNLIKTNNIYIKGTVSLNVVIEIDIPIELMVEIYKDENDKTKVRGYAYLDMSDLSIASSGLVGMFGYKIDEKIVKFYYDNETVYIYRKDDGGPTYQLAVNQETFLEDIVYYLLDYAMGLPEKILSQINTETNDEKKPIDAAAAWTKYSYSDNSFKLGFDIGELVGNSNLGALTLTLNYGNVTYKDETQYMLKTITDVNFALVGGFVNIQSSGLSVANINSNNVFTDADTSFISNYINNYSYEIDKMYKNGSEVGTIGHTVSFVYGLDLGGSSMNGVTGTIIDYPEFDVEMVEYNDVCYVFEGWYLDKAFTEPATITEIGEKSIKIFAHWKKVNKQVLTIAEYSGSRAYDTYDGADISKYLNYSLHYDSATGKYYIFEGFYTDSARTNKFDDTLMPNYDLTLYTKWEAAKFYARVNNDTVINEADLLENYSFNSSYTYYVAKNNVYYGLLGSQINPTFVINNYTAGIGLSDGNKIIVDIYTDLSLLDLSETYTLTFDYNATKFSSSKYKTIIVPNDVTVTYDMLPGGTYKYNELTYVINYWYNGNNDYYNDATISAITSSTTLYAYYSLSTEYFTVSGGVVSGFNATGSNIMLIFPKYYNTNGGIITTLQKELFMDRSDISSVYLNEGMTTIENDVFKNCTGLKTVYFSDTVTNVAEYAFYYEILSGWFSTNDFEESRDYAKELRFYMTTSSSLYHNHSNWQACHWNSSKKYYGNNYTSSGKVDLRSAFQTYSEGIEAKVHNLF